MDDPHPEFEISRAAHHIASRVEIALNQDLTVLAVLANSEALDGGDLAAFRSQARRIIDTGPGWLSITLSDAERHLVDTQIPSEEGHLPSPPGQIERVLQTGHPEISPVMRERDRGGASYVAVRTPVVRQGETRYVLTAVIPASRFLPLLREPPTDRDPDLVALIDQRDRFVARRATFGPIENWAGVPASPPLLSSASGDRPAFEIMLPSGDAGLASHADVPSSGWRVVVGMRSEPATASSSVKGLLPAGIVLAFGLAGWIMMRRNGSEPAAAPSEAERRLSEIAAHIPGMIYRRIDRPDGTSRYVVRAGGLATATESLPEIPAGAFGDDATNPAPVCFEQETRGPDGSTRWLRCVATPSRSADGAVVWDGLALDVTDLRQTEAALRHSENRLRLAQEAAGIISWDWDLITNQAVWSEPMGEFVGVAPGEPVPDPLTLAHRHLHADDQPAVIAGLSHALRLGGTLRFECRFSGVDGVQRWIRCIGRSVTDDTGRPIRLIGIIRDVTKRVQAQQALQDAKAALEIEVAARRQAETMLETLYATAPAGLCVIDSDLRFLRINQQLASIDGKPTDTYIGRRLSDVLPASLAEVLEPLCLATLASGIPVHAYEAVAAIPGDSGPPRHWLVSLHPLPQPDGGAGALNGMVQDITESKAMEATLRMALDEARDAIAAKGKFFAAASHDLRQPVQTLFLFAHVLQERLRDHPAQALVATMQQALEGLKTLIDTLLDISRLDSGTIAPELGEFPLVALFQRLQADYEPRMAAKGLRLRVAGSREWVRSDVVLLGRILGNLLDNALKYTAAGSVLIGCRRYGDALRIEVWDTGRGIPEDQQAAIFEEFVQLSNHRQDAAQGLGLGLSIVQRLARLLGHELGLRSRPGHGSVFSVLVPRAETMADRPGQRALLVAAARNQGPLAVVVDDDPTILSALGILLSEWGYEVVAAPDGDRALDAIAGRRRRPDLIITDYALGNGQTGPEVVRRIRLFCNTPVPAIILTGETGPERALEVGRIGSHLLLKPVMPDELRETVTRLVSPEPAP